MVKTAVREVVESAGEKPEVPEAQALSEARVRIQLDGVARSHLT